MKKVLILLFSLMISFNSFGGDIKSLFGITLNDTAEKYVSSNYINSNKVKDNETLDGFFSLYSTDIITAINPYFAEYWLTIDINNNIHSIQGSEGYASINRCNEFLETLSSSLEERYEVDLEYDETSFPSGKSYRYSYYSSLNNYFAVQCNGDDDELEFNGMIIYLDSEDLLEARNKYYDSGL